jgi:hypothetical protein
VTACWLKLWIQTAASMTPVPGQVVGPATLQTIADLQVELAETRAELVAQQIECASLRREREEVGEQHGVETCQLDALLIGKS